MAKATRSVMDVTVTLAPARPNPCAHRSTKVSSSSCFRGTFRSRSKALTMTNLLLLGGINVRKKAKSSQSAASSPQTPDHNYHSLSFHLRIVHTNTQKNKWQERMYGPKKEPKKRRNTKSCSRAQTNHDNGSNAHTPSTSGTTFNLSERGSQK